MALQSSGPIDISDIQTELGSSSGSLRTLSAAAGKSTPDAMSEFYGYSNFTASSNFAPILYTGNSSTQSITTGFQPDLVWMKGRSNYYVHQATDSVRGVTKNLFPNYNLSEYTETNTVQSFNSNGFTLGSEARINASGTTYVAWTWKAGNGTSTNTNGTVTSTVSANQAAGFSISIFTAPTTNNIGFTVGHGLSQAPEVFIIKDRDLTGVGWHVYSSHLPSSTSAYLQLNESNGTATAPLWNSANPTSSIINLRSGWAMGAGNKCVVYSWHSVAGYSKFGTFTGNDSTQTITTGFQPRWVMIKSLLGSSSGMADWHIYDSARGFGTSSSYTTPYLKANKTDTEVNNNYVSVTSTGFTMNTYYQNLSGWGDFFYMAFA